MRTCLILFAAVVSALAGLSGPVDGAMAARAIGNWRIRRGTLGTKMGLKVRDVRRVENKDKAVSYHVVRFEGGGVAVAPTDTAIRPVIMFSDGDDFDENPENPALALLENELVERARRRQSKAKAGLSVSASEREWAELLDADGGEDMSVSSVSDVRVASFVRTRWNQKNVDGYWCYNWYTPGHWYCGCVATALAQIVRTFEFPLSTTSFPRVTNPNCKSNDVNVALTTQGGKYNWKDMPYVPRYVQGDQTERQAIGKLTGDLGILLSTSYRPGGSGSATHRAKPVLERLGYKNAIALSETGEAYTGIGDDLQRILMSNFDAKLPVQIDLPGHSIVGDGYGYENGTLYYHLNFGLSNAAWYAPPDDLGGYACFEGAVYNIYPTLDGKAGREIASGRVTDDDDLPAVGVVVSAAKTSAPGTVVAQAVTDANGIYALFVPPGNYTISVSYKEGPFRWSGWTSATVRESVSREIVLDEGGFPTGSYYNDPEPQVGNAAQRDIRLSRRAVEAKATVEIGDGLAIGANCRSLAVPVTAQVLTFGETYTSAKVVVTLAPSDGGPVKTWESAKITGSAKTDCTAVFTGLRPGLVWQVDAQVKMGDDEMPLVNDVGIVAVAQKTVWIDERAATFPNARWSQTSGVAVKDGWISVERDIGDDAMIFTATSGVMNAEVNLHLKGLAGLTSSQMASCTPGHAALTLAEVPGALSRFAVWGDGRWNVTGVEAPWEGLDTAYDVKVVVNSELGKVAYWVRWEDKPWTWLGAYGDASAGRRIGAVSFAGAPDVATMSGVSLKNPPHFMLIVR